MRAHKGHLLVADTNRVLAVDPEMGTVFESARTGSAPARLTSAVPDINGNVLAADFKSNEIYVLSRLDDLLGGLSVRVLRVISDNFPTVTLEVNIENLHREAVVGLTSANFLITEDKRVAAGQELVGTAAANTDADITILIDRSPVTAARAAEVDWAVKEIAAALAASSLGGTLRIVAAGATPLTEYTGPSAEGSRFAVDRLRTPVTRAGKTDMAVRLAANDLINARQKRAIIYLTAGSLAPDAFDRYGLTDLCAYLNNNHIAFYSINLGLEPLSDEIIYLTQNTDGSGYYVYRPEGLAPLVTEITQHPSGLYVFTYTSSLPTDFGRALLPVEVECYHLNQSGRGESAYFAPLQ
jgi:DNA-binding beta-propeller fold protein YncE